MIVILELSEHNFESSSFHRYVVTVFSEVDLKVVKEQMFWKFSSPINKY